MNFIPVNDLDRALIAGQRSVTAIPEVYRQLGEGQLFLLIPYQPGMEEGDAVQIQNGMEFPFARLHDEEGQLVPIFTSEERAQEGLAQGKVPPETFFIVSMEAMQVMEVLGKMEMRALVNKSCGTPEFIIPPNLMRDIASGAIFQPVDTSACPCEEKNLTLLDAADYPTDLVQAAFDVMRSHRPFRAAWIFLDPEEVPRAQGGQAYQLLILMDPRDDLLYHEFSMVMAAAVAPGDTLNHGLIDEDDAVYVADIFRQAEPFYLALDFGKKL